MRQTFLISIVIFFIQPFLVAEDRGPDKMYFKDSRRKKSDGWIKKEDSDNCYFTPVKGARPQGYPWSDIDHIVYADMSQDTLYGNNNFEIGNWKGADRKYTKVLTRNVKKWEKDLALYRIALCKLYLGNPQEARASLEKIKLGSRWYYPAMVVARD